MKILYLCHTIVSGGADFERGRQLGMALSARGHQVTLLASAPERSLTWYKKIDATGQIVLGPPDIFLFRLRQAGLSPMDAIGRYSYLVGREFDVVHLFGHRPAAYMPARRLHRTSDSRLVADWSDRWGDGGLADRRSPCSRWTLGALDDRWERASRLEADGLTVVSHDLATQALTWGVPNDRILRLGLGSNTDQIRPRDRQEARTRVGLPPDISLVFYSGQSRFDWPLARQVLLDMMRRHAETGVLLVGRQAQAMRQSLGPHWHKRTFAFGYVPQEQLGELLSCADVVLLPFPDEPSNQARLPNRLGDSMAAGRPVVSNHVGEVGEIIRREEIGLAVGEAPDEMADAVAELLEDATMARKMGQRGRRAAEARYAWPILADSVLSFYQRLVSS